MSILYLWMTITMECIVILVYIRQLILSKPFPKILERSLLTKHKDTDLIDLRRQPSACPESQYKQRYRKHKLPHRHAERYPRQHHDRRCERNHRSPPHYRAVRSIECIQCNEEGQHQRKSYRHLKLSRIRLILHCRPIAANKDA